MGGAVNPRKLNCEMLDEDPSAKLSLLESFWLYGSSSIALNSDKSAVLQKLSLNVHTIGLEKSPVLFVSR